MRAGPPWGSSKLETNWQCIQHGLVTPSAAPKLATHTEWLTVAVN
jgi:hypothetical protein